MEEIKDLLLIRLIAHSNYISPRIHDKKRQTLFVQTIRSHIFCINNGLPFLAKRTHKKNSGVDMAIDVYEDIANTLRNRFILHREGNFVLEKL